MRLSILVFASILLTVSAWGQERLRNVRIRAVDSSQLEIRYDLLSVHPGDSVYFEVNSRSRGQLIPSLGFVQGDVGVRTSAGKDKRIVWDALANGYFINEDIRARVMLKTNTSSPTVSPTVTISAPATQPTPTSVATQSPTAPPTVEKQPVSAPVAASPTPSPVPLLPDTAHRPRQRYAGPAWALLSAVAPGIGNIFVQTPKPKVGIRPALTLGCYGLIVYGLMERSKSMDAYATYKEQRNATAAMPYYQTANDLHHRYYLATRGAVAIAAVDVLLTFFKGLHNGRLRRKMQVPQGVSLRPSMQASQFTAVLRYSF